MVLGRKTLKKLADDEYIKEGRIIQEELDAVSDVCITYDTRTSININSIISITCHFINNDFELNSYTLEDPKFIGENREEHFSSMECPRKGEMPVH